ncbi:hypothetical protein RvY_06296-2 [Ramazzottius varieornatus]|uniref:Uncharacterized protein n=1 Tax=Ramazzottius varieornatus TaxID=947166 RepID=A0A1D1UYM8_RAMVA|nr:hypothetical protein RvY_06296-2 [Ramazzottius varieornatus]
MSSSTLMEDFKKWRDDSLSSHGLHKISSFSDQLSTSNSSYGPTVFALRTCLSVVSTRLLDLLPQVQVILSGLWFLTVMERPLRQPQIKAHSVTVGFCGEWSVAFSYSLSVLECLVSGVQFVILWSCWTFFVTQNMSFYVFLLVRILLVCG